MAPPQEMDWEKLQDRTSWDRALAGQWRFDYGVALHGHIAGRAGVGLSAGAGAAAGLWDAAEIDGLNVFKITGQSDSRKQTNLR